MSFLTQFDALATPGADPQAVGRERARLLAEWLNKRAPELLAELQERRPTILAPGLCVVTRHADVREVLSQDRVFTVRPYTARMEQTTGAFILGMARTAQNDRELSALRLACDRADVDRVAAIARGGAEELLKAAVPCGRLNLAEGYARRVALRVVAEYFGTPGPDEATMGGWLRILFREIFLNLGNDPAVTQEARAAAAGLKAYLDPLIARRRAEACGNSPAPDVLTRLVRLTIGDAPVLDADGVRRNIGGTIVGAVETVNKAFVQAFDQLLARPEALARARAAAAAGDDDAVLACVWEAMRFRPQNPFLYRLSAEEYTLARGTDRETTIPAGTLVFAATSSAMLDPTFVPSPNEFRPGRPAETYLFFGYTLHRCLGEFVAGVEFRELAKPLLRLPHLQRVPGEEGQLHYEGPYPTALWVEVGKAARS